MRTIRRFISRACVLGQNAASSCLGTVTNNNSTITPTPTGAATNVCLAGGPVGTNVPPTLVPNPAACSTSCNGSHPSCPDFSAAGHLDGNGFLTRTTFCRMNINGTTIVRTSEQETGVGTGNNDDTITVLRNLVIEGQASLRLSDDATVPLTTSDNTTIIVLWLYILKPTC